MTIRYLWFKTRGRQSYARSRKSWERLREPSTLQANRIFILDAGSPLVLQVKEWPISIW